MRLTIPRPFTEIISVNRRLVRLDVLRRRGLLPPLVRTSIPEPVRRKRLAVALWVLSLYLPLDGLRGTVVLLSHKIPRCRDNHSAARQTAEGLYLFDLRTATAPVYFFLVPLLGDSTISIVRPSNAGDCSIAATSDKSSATDLRSSSAISG